MHESSDGWIKVYRSLLYSEIFQNEKLLKIFIWCLLKANHKENKVMVGKRSITVKRGQFIFGRAKAAEELNIAPSTVWDYMKVLEDKKTIKIKSNNKYSLVTIEKWELYQKINKTSDNKSTTDQQQNNNSSTTNRQQIDTNKNVKNIKNIYTSKIDELWSLYPNKKGKKIAYKKIERLLDQYSFEELKRCVERYSLETKGKDKQYIQHGSTFFNSGYVDYLDSNYDNTTNVQRNSSSWMDVDSL